ncbi:hypothetical protein ACO2I3_20215 [Leptospira interrogans]
MRMWFGIVLLLAGLGLAAVNMRVPAGSVGLEEAFQNIQAAQAPAVAPNKARAAGGDRTAVRRAVVAGSNQQPFIHVAAAPWDRQEIFIGRQGVVSEQPEQSIPTNRYELARELQTELRRVGCYYGEIDGDWGSGSKRAMSGFTSRVNASLPVDAPDAIMLTMIRRFDGQACSATCRSDEMFTGDGRCVPTTVVAQDRASGRLQSASAEERPGMSRAWSVMVQPPVVGEMTRTATVEPLPGRMSVGGPVEAAPPVPVTREGSLAAPPPIADARPRAEARPRNAQNERSAPRRKRWTQTIFDEIAARN